MIIMMNNMRDVICAEMIPVDSFTSSMASWSRMEMLGFFIRYFLTVANDFGDTEVNGRSR